MGEAMARPAHRDLAEPWAPDRPRARRSPNLMARVAERVFTCPRDRGRSPPGRGPGDELGQVRRFDRVGSTRSARECLHLPATFQRWKRRASLRLIPLLNAGGCFCWVPDGTPLLPFRQRRASDSDGPAPPSCRCRTNALIAGVIASPCCSSRTSVPSPPPWAYCRTRAASTRST
jgi:hypothetical protein